jgi:hypothetical protein
MSLRNWLIKMLDGATKDQVIEHGRQMHALGMDQGVKHGKTQARTEFAILPLPFTADQLAGKEYGTFITPAGFAHTFGECNIPAPGQYGYEQRAGYIRKTDIAAGPFVVLADVAEEDREYFVPVIVTVLR